MGSRAWVVIMSMGLVGLCLLGLLTKFAIDSNPDLLRMIEFKAALANTFADQGVEDVSMRKIHARGYHILLTVDSARQSAPADRLDLGVARYFAEKFPDRTVFALEIEQAPPPSFGCEAAPSRGKRQFSLGEVRAGMAEEDRVRRFEERIASETGFRLEAFDRRGSAFTIRVEAPPGFAGDLGEGARKVEATVRSLFASRYSTLAVRARAGAPLPAPGVKPGAAAPAAQPELEVLFDPRGREIEAPPASGRP